MECWGSKICFALNEKKKTEAKQGVHVNINSRSPLRQEEHTQITHPYKYSTAASVKYDASKDHDERTRGVAQRT